MSVVGFPLYFTTGKHLFEPKRQFWLVAYVAGIAVISYLGDPTFITEMAKPLQLQSLLFGDGQSFIRGVAGEVPLDEHLLGCETPKRSLEEQEADLIAEYDADFLASIRIQPPVEPSSS